MIYRGIEAEWDNPITIHGNIPCHRFDIGCGFINTEPNEQSEYIYDLLLLCIFLYILGNQTVREIHAANHREILK